MPTDDSAEIMDVNEAAAFLRVHIETVRRMARRRALPCFKVGKDWRFKRSALDHWATAHSSANVAPLVLIIDDEELVCKALGRIVERIGCRARHALSGAQGLQLVAQDVPDLILLDLKMPDINGPWFLKELRKTQPDLPVVIVTGYPDGDLMAQAMAHGPLVLLAKPVAAAQLQKLVTMLVGKRLTAGVRTEPEALAP